MNSALQREQACFLLEVLLVHSQLVGGPLNESNGPSWVGQLSLYRSEDKHTSVEIHAVMLSCVSRCRHVKNGFECIRPVLRPHPELPLPS